MGMSIDAMKAMILAAGEGTRLRPLTLETSKVLLPMGEVPLIEHQLCWLKSHGISQVAINLYHMGDSIKDFLDNGSRFGMKIIYSPEETLLGTAGGVKRMNQFFNETFVVLYGDNLTEFDLSAMIEFHQEKNAMATLAVFKVPNPWEVGIVKMAKNARILSLMEKPPLDLRLGNWANGGIYVFEKEVLSYIPSQDFSDFACDVFPKLINLGLPIYGFKLKPEDYFIDIGTLDQYQKANNDVKAGKIKIRHEEQGSISG